MTCFAHCNTSCRVGDVAYKVENLKAKFCKIYLLKLAKAVSVAKVSNCVSGVKGLIFISRKWAHLTNLLS